MGFKKVLIPMYTRIQIGKTKVPVTINGEIVYQYRTAPTLNPLYTRLEAEYVNLIRSQLENPNEIFIGGMPVQLELSCVSQLFRKDRGGNFAYQMTMKVDGERFLAFHSMDGIIYFIDRAMNFYIFVDSETDALVAHLDPNVIGQFLFDGEMYYHKQTDEWEYLVFDVLYYQNESRHVQNWISTPYTNRFDVLRYAVSTVLDPYYTAVTKGNIRCSYKLWFPIDLITSVNGDIYKYIINESNKLRLNHPNLNKCEKRTAKYQLKSDGLILQPFDTSYVCFRAWNEYNNVTFKWKPEEDLTIDFEIRIEPDGSWTLLTGSGQPFRIKMGNDKQGKPAMCNPTPKQKEIYQNGDVAEFVIAQKQDPRGDRILFNVVRPRPEKQANSLNTAMSTMNVINNAFKLDKLRDNFKAIESINTDKGNFTDLAVSALQTMSKSNLILDICKYKLKNYFNPAETESIQSVYDEFIRQIEMNQILNTNFELECRIFKNGKKTLAVDKFTFYYLYDYLRKRFPLTREITYDVSEETGSGRIRSTYPDNIDIIKSENPIVTVTKEKIKNIFLPAGKKQQEELRDSQLYNNLIMKIELSAETPIKQVVGLRNSQNSTRGNNIRRKNRLSFQYSPLWRIDLTIVNTDYSLEKLYEKEDIFELELEYLGDHTVDFDQFMKSLNTIYMDILYNSNYC